MRVNAGGGELSATKEETIGSGINEVLSEDWSIWIGEGG
jgi:hypothetical protein